MTSQPTHTLYRGARIESPAVPGADAMLVRGADIVWMGNQAQAPSGDFHIEQLEGIVLPAFVDSHVHTTATGLAQTGLDLSQCRGANDLLDKLSMQSGDLVIGHGWDETRWEIPTLPTPAELDRAAPGTKVYLSRVDVHSALVSPRLRAAVDGLEGATGYSARGALSRDAHHQIRTLVLSALTSSQRRTVQSGTLTHAARRGVGAIHECGGPLISGEDDFTELLALAKSQGGVEVTGFWGEFDPRKAREMGAVSAGGDLFVDGSFGSRTALLREPYTDDAGRGFSYTHVDEIAQHLVACVRENIAAGFHAIGDAAIAAVLEGYAKAAATVGTTALREGRHRLEHAELLDAGLIRGLVEYGLTVSAQPAFDARWGGPGGMHEQRLGAGRAAQLNPLAALYNVGVPVVFGSDSPVTPIAPWAALRGACRPHHEQHAVSVKTAFAAHTRAPWRSIGNDSCGVLAPGALASFAVWRADDIADPSALLRAVVDSEEDPMCERTVVRGRDVFRADVG
ncbi:MAG: amidohydrolase family protein [Corynebacteriales bacterium]|nr:amidohydrolase family protein [Mycobacteriales bacterium]